MTDAPTEGRMAQGAFRDALLRAGLLIATGVDGLYGRGAMFEDVVTRLEARISAIGAADGAEVMRFPPAITRQDLQISGYMGSFPQLAGTIHCFCGDERAHQGLMAELVADGDWTRQQKTTELALTPAACYPVYPVLARRGALADDGALIDVYSYCFRHEPSIDPARMQMFRQREYVCLGDTDQVLAFRETWLRRATDLVAALSLPFAVDVANDPFFGRTGRLLSESQRAQQLKFELLVPLANPESPTACVSFNYHIDHFGQAWNIRTARGAVAHTACVGFGMERLTLALFRHHGLDVADWPPAVRTMLWSATS